MTRQWVADHFTSMRVLVGALAVLCLISLVQNRITTTKVEDDLARGEQVLAEIQEANRVNRAVLRTIEDCVTPDGECAQRGERRTARAVGDISVASVITSSCSPFVPEEADAPKERYEALVTCIQRLREQLPPPEPPK